ncbi:hypothetical protein GCM10022271_18170 [Corallibacter vietnamensis]|uniref:Carboxypeptidase-like regulatory domain-containing protein n=1 Tax=Corallibacter vietnamensis TaxID=904130 RepID=A0ABP7H955_9FLAO
MLKQLLLFFVLFISITGFSQITIKDNKTQSPISYATISFGNGQGIFADDEGVFVFTKKLYHDVDSLRISALGFKEYVTDTSALPKTIFLEEEISTLDEVVIHANLENRKFKEETLKPYLDDNYYHCWLPTIESEIAVYFSNPDSQLKKITTIHFPITLESKDWDKRNRKNAEKKPFSTLFKVKFYKNNNGTPGDVLTYENIIFRVTEKHGDLYDLDISDLDIFFPKTGFFVSIQVLGYTDKNGKLLPNKKYKEIKTREGVVKIPTNFRPLLPFTNEIKGNNTYIKRVFLNNNSWTRFQRGSMDSSLLKSGLTNYGVGISYNAYKDE